MNAKQWVSKEDVLDILKNNSGIVDESMIYYAGITLYNSVLFIRL